MKLKITSVPLVLFIQLCLLLPSETKRFIAVVGGGAAGYFSAIEAANIIRNKGRTDIDVIVFEVSKTPLQKVLISGGGRCNVMHNPQKGVPLISRGYPRGSRELISPFNTQFGPDETYAWFSSKGVDLKIEVDGRVFPTSDKSTTIIESLESQAKSLGVKVRCSCSVTSIVFNTTQSLFTVSYTDSSLGSDNDQKVSLSCEKIILATGSSRIGHGIAKSLGHTIVSPLPSLFSFKINDPILCDLAGVSAQNCLVKILITSEFMKSPNKSLLRGSSAVSQLSQNGPVLITHQGLTGPAILRLSAFGAKVLAAMDYKCQIEVSWIGPRNLDDVQTHLAINKKIFPLAQVGKGFPKMVTEEHNDSDNDDTSSISRRLWIYLLQRAGVEQDKRWADLSNKDIICISKELVSSVFNITGRGVYRDEFVTCGGVALKEIEFSRMESKIIPGLFFAGEILDIDGITGGYNFQSAWTSGWIAGHNSGQQ